MAGNDLLVKLYALPPLEHLPGVDIRRGIAPEKHIVVQWALEHFSPHWASEVDVAYGHLPVTCYVATEDETLLGFACYDATHKAFFGPTGVSEAARGRGIGRALLLAALHGMAQAGYAYGIIGSAGPVDFYKAAVGAIEIPGSNPGIYRGMLRK